MTKFSVNSSNCLIASLIRRVFSYAIPRFPTLEILWSFIRRFFSVDNCTRVYGTTMGFIMALFFTGYVDSFIGFHRSLSGTTSMPRSRFLWDFYGTSFFSGASFGTSWETDLADSSVDVSDS